MPGPPRGAHIGKALSGVLADVLTKHQAASLPGTQAAKFNLWTLIAERIERASAEELQPILGELLEVEDLPEPAKQLARAALQPPAQDKVLVALAAMVGAFFVVTGAAAQPYGAMFAAAAWRAQPVARLTAEQMAEALIRGVVDQGRATAEARENGLNSSRFDVLAALAGEPPALQSLLELYRRGEISKARLEHGIRQSRVRNEWIDAVEMLRFGPLSPSIAVDAAVQNQTSRATAKRLAAEGGLNPDHFDLAFAVAGRPPGVVEMIELWQRGEVTEHDVRQTIAESDVKTKYTDALLKLKRRLLPADTIASMVGAGVFTEREGLAKLMEHGYDHRDAQAWIDRHTLADAQTQRDAARGEVLALYEARAISRAKAVELLASAGYQRHLVELDLDLVDSKRVRAARAVAVSRVHALYVAFRIERPDAAGLLDQLGLPADQTRELVKVWDLERRANTKDLTKTEIVSAYTRGVFTLAEASRRLEGIGYRGTDAAVILAEHAPPEARERTLTTAQILASARRGDLTREQAAQRLAELGYVAGDAALLLRGIQ